jgi:H/ACA ribonucleoprotein complex subunit 4
MKASPVERGILLLDKPEELTSMQCVEVSKRILKARKAGHSGTLDPKVTGLMIIAFNEATKAMPVLIGMDKTYEGVMRVHGTFTKEMLARTIKGFTGRITQTPPKRSAVVRKPRERDVLSFEVLSINERDVAFRTTCSAGTYIRKLCHDIGEALGTGAHMASLRRIGIGPFSIDEAFTMDQLESRGDSCLFPLEGALDRIRLPLAAVPGSRLDSISNGVPLELSELRIKPIPTGLFGLVDSQGRLVALARKDGRLAKPERVFN